MKTKALGLFLCVFLQFLSGCNPTEGQDSSSRRVAEATAERDGPGNGLPGDYFPTAQGTKWVYKIEVGPAEPLQYEEVVWPQGKTALTYATRSRFRQIVGDEKRKTFSLELRVKQPASEQGPKLRYPKGVLLEILKDELGVYGEAKEVYWAIGTSGRFMAHLVLVHNPDAPGAPSGPRGRWSSENGYSMRLLFFGDRPGLQIGIGKEPSDKLLFEGIENRASFTKAAALLHFIRSVEGNIKARAERSYLDSAFTEDLWFAKGKGLVRLEQKVEGKTSMVWTLVEAEIAAESESRE